MKTLAERMDRMTVKIPGGCWEWVGSRYRNGYGRTWSGDYAHRDILVHRAAWMLNNGPIPDGMFVCHSCDNRACVNPQHLWLGTREQNMKDMVTKDRQTYGEDQPSAKLSDVEVEAIRSDVAWGEPQSAIAKWYGVSQTQVSRIASRKQRKRPSKAV